MNVCARCGFPLEAGAVACTRCGGERVPAPATGNRWGTLDIPKRVLQDLQAEVAAARAAAAAQPSAAGSAKAPARPGQPEPREFDQIGSQPLDALNRLDAADSGNALDSDPGGGSLELELGEPVKPPARAARPATAPVAAPRGAGRAATGPVAAPRAPAGRGATGPVSAPRVAGPPQHPALAGRSATGPVSADARASAGRPNRAATGSVSSDARVHSGALPGGRGRAQSGALSTEAVARASLPRAGSQPLGVAAQRAQSQPQGSPPVAAGTPDNSNHLDTGMLEIEGRFSGAGRAPQGPSLDLVSIQPPAKALEEPQPMAAGEPAREPSPAQRARRVQELARYGEPPTGPIGAIPYFLRTYSRRRELETKLATLSHQRKRLDLEEEDVQCLLGQALYTRGADPQLRPLAAQLRVVSESANAVGSRLAAAKLSEEEQRFELAALERERGELDSQAAPDRLREGALRQEIESRLSDLKASEHTIRQAEAELASASAGTHPSGQSQLPELQAQRAEQLALVQSGRAELARLRAALASVQASLAKHAEKLAQLDARRAKLVGMIDREQGRERISSGGAQSAVREALRALASLALRQDLGRLVPNEARAAVDATERASKHRESEELTRAAVQSYDQAAYKRGQQLLIGVVIAVFLLFVGLIAI